MDIAFVIVLGLLIGSFLNVCICRIPLEQSIVYPPSHCTNCGATLTARDLIPLLSYIWLRGRCRHCQASISLRYPLLELLTAAVFLLLYLKYGSSVDFAAAAFLMAILIVVFFIDYDYMIIPNELVGLTMLGGLLLFVYSFFGPVGIYGDRDWWNPLLGALTGSGLLLITALLGSCLLKSDEAMGGGDIKILLPIGLFLGWRMMLLTMLISILLGGFTVLILLMLRVVNRKEAIPFGPFIVLATFLALLEGWNIMNWYLSLY